jgi:hypothetical protein
VHRYLKQAVDLKGLLIAAGEGLKVQWDAPRLHKVGELLMAGRISVNLCSALATAGQQRLFHLAIASTQASTLGKMFQWPWVKIEKTFTKSAIDAFPQSTARCQDFKEIKVSAHALLVPGRLSTTLQSACHYITNVFNSSRFYLQSSVRTLSLSKGEASREYYYWVFAGGSGPQGDAPSYMGRLSGWALGLFSPRKVSIYYSSS